MWPLTLAVLFLVDGGGEDVSILRHGYLLGMNLPVTGIFASLVGNSILYKPLFATFTELGVDPYL